MAIRGRTLRIGSQLRTRVGTEADQATRDLTQAWVKAWDQLSADMTVAVQDAVLLAQQLGHWPAPGQLTRITRLHAALLAAQESLVDLGQQTGVTVTDAAGRAITATAEVEPQIIGSQFPASLSVEASARFAARVLPVALQAIVHRTAGQITAATWPLSADATVAMNRALIKGVVLGSNPRVAASQMVAAVEGEFNGGLARAVNIARTEILDAYRATAEYVHAVNADVLSGWIWLCHLGARTCPACLAMNGSVHPLTEPGPHDHQSGRCTRMPQVKSWDELGIKAPEPKSTIPDARGWFATQPEATQVAMLGRGRLDLLRSGRISWDDLPMRRTTAGWRPSYAPRTLQDLRQLARPGGRTTAAAAPGGGFADLVAAAVKARKAGTLQFADLYGGMSASTRVATLPDGRKLVNKARASWDAPEQGRLAADAERLASRAAEVLGADVPAVIRDGDEAVWMEFVPGSTVGRLHDDGRIDEYQRARDTPAGKRLGLMDALIGNADRNSGNLIVTPGGVLTGIDHGFAWAGLVNESTLINAIGGQTRDRPIAFFAFIGRGYPATRHWVDNPMTAGDVVEVRRRLESLRREFASLGREAWLDKSLQVLDELARYAKGTESIL